MVTILEKIHHLYIHFPYCETKCHYCDFFSLPEAKFAELDRLSIYESICNELHLYAKELGAIKTLFLGGGTPSLVPLQSLERILSPLCFSGGYEATLEANPSSITLENAKAWKELGVNRVSIGMQALNDERLEWLGRVHSKAEFFDALSVVFQAGFENISVDYILGVPGLTLSLIQSELNELFTAFPGIKHVSAYLLTLKTSNPKYKNLLTEEEQLQHLEASAEVLQSLGFEHYEVSNFAKPGFTAKHNQNYWLGQSYLGIGPSAHSYSRAESTRWKNWASLGKYQELLVQGQRPIEWQEQMTIEQQRLEYLMLNLRTKKGLDLKEFERRFGEDLVRSNESRINQWIALKLCQHDPTISRLSLSSKGFFLSDQILGVLA